MNISNFLDLLKLRRLSAFRRRRAAARTRPEQEPALRAELFSTEQMERHGRALAGQHRLSARSSVDLLLARLADNEAVLTHTCERLTDATRKRRRITPAGEWLLDNFYLIEEQIRIARRHLPKGYSRELPRLANGPSAGLPRVYDIALEIISHGDGRVDTHSLLRFIGAYQDVTPLRLGELWAIPIMLRLALIENLRRVAARVMADWGYRGKAVRWADSMTSTAERDANSVVLVVADMARSNPPMNGPFVAEMARRLQGQSPALALPLSWIEQRLAASGQSIEHLVQLEAQQQAANQVTISNSIGSLRTLSAIDWRDFVEHSSLVEQRLREDPAGVYAAMDFATRDRYRHVVEAMARRHRLTELQVAEAAIALSQAEAPTDCSVPLPQHVGYYLIDRGRRRLEQQLGIRPPLRETLRRGFDRAPLPIYLGLLALLTFAFAQPLVAVAAHDRWPTWALLALAIPAAILASQLGLSLLNWLATLSIEPRQLPRMDYSHGIPASARTLVAIPSLFASAQDVDELVESLEVRFLGNRDEQLHFALLTDFADADRETLPDDEALLRRAQRRIEALNERYAGDGADRFFLFHRPRRWNPGERCWMGHERKRGKLADLNALLRGNAHGRFMLIVGDIAALGPVQYVITLDTDTELPRDAAQAFVGTIDHPLNRAVYDPEQRRVVSGYAILQPRVGISLPSTARSRYAQLYGSDAGIDPYTQMVSDVYQDVFGEGSFIGKGIYAIDPFERTLDGRFPENRILSHDLVEGCHARSGLLSDVQLFETYPARYGADVRRRHRWIRGDWQLLPWLLPWAPTAHAGWRRNALTALSRWKILDNLRRSLVPVAVLALLAAGWLLIAPVLSWTVAVLSMVLLPPLLSALLELVQKPREVQLDQHLRAGFQAGLQHFARMLLGLAWLPHEALYHLDAIVRTLWRMAISQRQLLQWQTSSEVERRSGHTAAVLWRSMWIGPALAVLLGVALVLQRPLALWLAAPLLLLWLGSPAIAWWISQPRTPDAFAPNAAQRRFLRTLARQTWAFFDTHVGAADHWLPPDNLQEQPGPAIAHRTSPTNIGMALLANLAAHDFGFLGTGRLLERTRLSLATMQQLPRHRGHFYNWYDTQSLQPLAPLYVSAVDSGNLAGHLLTLRPGLHGLPDEPVFQPRVLHGLLDTLALLHDTLDADAARALEPLRQQLQAGLAAPPAIAGAATALLQQLRGHAQALLPMLDSEPGSDARFWLDALLAQCDELCTEAAAFELDPPADDEVGFGGIPTLRQLARIEPLCWPASADADGVRARAHARIAAIEQLAQLAGELALMDYRFLYDSARDLLAIGFNVDQRRLDAGYYDLLASEARLASFVGIAQGQLPQDNWFSLGRLLTTVGGEPVLLSWTGSMFEYLMPMLVMPNYEGTLLDQTCRAAVTRQIEYGSQLGVPWGVSESGYNTLDAHFTYQYRAFGVPGLGLKRGLGDDVVVAPYASALALMVAPAAATRNLQRLAEAGARGRFGLYEAIDYTPARLPLGQDSALVRQFMAHHQGMSLLALGHALLDRPMQRRFESDPQFQATSLLLQERVPKTAAEYLHASGFPESDGSPRPAEARLRVFTDPDRTRPAVQLLSNGHYHVMLSSAGGGYIRRGELALTRWREDITRDHWGMFCYLRDVASGEYWSTTYQPTRKKTEQFEAIFSDARAEFRVREREFDAHTEIVVSPEDDIGLRRTRISNRSRTRRTIELTSYAEVVLAPPLADALHPAFSKLFVQTELVPALQAIVCTRRPRAADEHVPWMFHLLAVHDADIDAISYETDRSRFIGRGRSTAEPQALDREQAQLSNSAGSVLDPIVAIRCRITLEPEQSATIDFVTGIADRRDDCLQLIGKYRDRHLADRVFDLAWTHSQVLLRQLNASLADAQLYEHMATGILYPNASLRAEPAVLRGNRRGQSGLWGQAISGDLPIVLLQIASPARIELVRQLVQAHAYWRLKGLAVDLVIWNEDRAGYRQELQDQIMGLIASGSEASLLDRPGGIFVRPAQQLSGEDRLVVLASARIILNDGRGSLAEQIGRRRVGTHAPRFEPSRPRRIGSAVLATSARAAATLQLANPHGGFSSDGREYVITQAAGDSTPAPWSNVLANPHFGTVISDSGSAYTWGENAHEFRLSPWHNDPVGDDGGEALYLRDEETGQVWSPTPLPCRGSGTYVTRHGFGYSVFEHHEDGIHSELWVYVALDASVKFSVLKLRNESGQARRLSVTGYVEWLLGDLREKTAMHVVTESDPASGALLARNAYNTEFPNRVAFFDVDDAGRGIDGDRSEFLGRNGSMRAPAGLGRAQLSGRLGAGLDPCAALQSSVSLDDGEQRQLIFRLGLGRDAADASALVQRFRGSGSAADALEKVRAHWARTLGTVQVRTPEPALDVLANGWLLYQTIACRMWARSGYYQSGGAFGFRDQLQDSMALLHAAPALSRAQLLLCAAHQFPEGDVQHWWHPPLDRGVRTTCSDDYLWLPLATSRYVLAGIDRGVLDERVGYIESRELHPGEESYYDLPQPSGLHETLYQHCVRAIERSLTQRGAHGLPLIGGGDWNDGMNRVGEKGRGESVWLGFFSGEVLSRFAEVARLHDDEAFAQRCEDAVAQLRIALEQHGWDGAWYRRAWFDDGTPLGSAGNDECRIDSIAQSWSVLSGMASPERRQQAMNSLDAHLVRRDAGLVQLLNPPFDKSALDPGYIKGYVPGVRENGGQYTHAAIWATMAFAELGDSARAWELLRMINPVNHGIDAAQMDVYKVEPYVVSADVYAVEPHTGRGGWSWYTGSAGWMYRLIVESLLGLRLEAGKLRFAPVLPPEWEGFSIDYRHHDTPYRIHLRQSEAGTPSTVWLDGVAQADGCIPLADDGAEHSVELNWPRST
ncbi:cyclic beta 1-2 glucan synthetase [Rhodanobacter sp. Soil772]|uniref:GH36-type glycosyl hydrolase domain-containing protein n=1 Tax=Rhodanobacter sp. Soil772 TaxID=1736406 RepID=UPI0006F40E4A|nr:glucoamylase family protein [Rhodanobacter sp. Soil772]KRE86136.1 cyclic beta 1-2 glucan synthetase [Rhodanobacter sp. Soil772]